MGWRHSDPASGRTALAEPALHVVFCDSGAECLRAALKLAGRPDEVVCLLDDLSLGPIAVTAGRTAWFEREMGIADWGEADAARSGFWAAALSPGRRRVAWWSWRQAREYCGFLQFVSRLGDEPCDAMDLSDAPVAHAGQDGARPAVGVARTLALLRPEQVAGSGLLNRAEPLATQSRAALGGRWSRLRTEDAPVRVPTGGGNIISAPLSLFDDALVRNTTDQWQPTVRTVAEVLTENWDEQLYKTGDLLLKARVYALAAAGRIELRGGDPRQDMAGTEIRLPGREVS